MTPAGSKFGRQLAFFEGDDRPRVRSRTLFLSRDRLGVKPLYYSEKSGRLHFASEVGALRAVMDLREANEAKLHDYLAYGYRTNDGDTFFAGIRELPPGCNLEWRAGRALQSCYWALPEETVPLRIFIASGSFSSELTSRTFRFQ